MGNESSGDQPRIKLDSANTVIRRVQDKAFGLLVFFVIGLIGTVYAIHNNEIKRADEHAGDVGKKLDTHAEKTKAEVEKLQVDQRAHGERVRALEENRSEINRRLDSIDKSLERQDVKHDQVNTKIDRLLDRAK